MNKTLITILATITCLGALAQGTFNAVNTYTPPGGSSIAYVRGVDGLPLSNVNGRIQITTTDGTVINTVKDTFAAPGVFALGVLEVPGATTTANLIIRSWDITSGATYADALIKGEVAVTVTGLGSNATGAPPATLRDGSNFVGLTLTGTIIPEPSTVALAAFGVAGLFFVARRKS